MSGSSLAAPRGELRTATTASLKRHGRAPRRRRWASLLHLYSIFQRATSCPEKERSSSSTPSAAGEREEGAALSRAVKRRDKEGQRKFWNPWIVEMGTALTRSIGWDDIYRNRRGRLITGSP
jgi:hypothetical protein